LDLSYNYIGPLQISTFSLLKKLKTFNLKSTNISNIEFGTFSHQDKVENFNIADNNLGYFDLNMIFSMSNLLRLDVSGNDLKDLTSVDQAHHLFALLQTIDITKNRFTCRTLMRLLKTFKLYKVSVVKSNIEHQETNINGIICAHVEGEDDIKPMVDGANITDILKQINQISEKLNINSELVKNLMNKPNQPQKQVMNTGLEVKNSKLMETSLIIVCVCFTVFMGLQIFLVIKKNFLDSSFNRRPLLSHSVSMNVDDI
jgi:hypothetical protein